MNNTDASESVPLMNHVKPADQSTPAYNENDDSEDGNAEDAGNENGVSSGLLQPFIMLR